MRNENLFSCFVVVISVFNHGYLMCNLVFPVYKIDREHLVKKTISKERLKIPKRYSEVVVFENFLKRYSEVVVFENFLKD